eukprot:3477461-Rhodomonas_salina.2
MGTGDRPVLIIVYCPRHEAFAWRSAHCVTLTLEVRHTRPVACGAAQAEQARLDMAHRKWKARLHGGARGHVALQTSPSSPLSQHASFSCLSVCLCSSVLREAKPAKEGRTRLQMGGEKGGMASMRRELCPPGVRQCRGGIVAAHREHAPHWPLPASSEGEPRNAQHSPSRPHSSAAAGGAWHTSAALSPSVVAAVRGAWC